MLKIILAGLVMQKILTLAEAEWIDTHLQYEKIPSTVKEVVEEIKNWKLRYKAYKKNEGIE